MITKLNLNEFSRDTVIYNRYQSQGVTVSTIGGFGRAMTFDAVSPTDNDGLDDNQIGCTFRFTFENATSVECLTFLDNKDGATVRFFNGMGKIIGQQDVLGRANQPEQLVKLNVKDTYRMDVLLRGAGTVNDLVFEMLDASVSTDASQNTQVVCDVPNTKNVVPCFTSGTLIATSHGERRVEELAAGDRIITRDNGIQTIRWVGSCEMTGAAFETAAYLMPIMIQKNALGWDLPERDMMVSPNQRVLIASERTALYFEEAEVLIAAKHLTALAGVDVADVSATTYIYMMLEQHEVVLSNGAWMESMPPCVQSLEGVDDLQRAQILGAFPELESREGFDGSAPARRTLKKHEAYFVIN